jgi:hypothetical protein
MVGFLTPLIGLATTWFEGQTKKSAAKADAEVALKNAEAEVYKRRATGELDWDLAAMNNTDKSWKDEYLLILFSIPFVMAFIPPLQPYVQSGINLISNFPDWYKAGLSVMIAASFGVRSYLKFWRKNAKSN